MLCLLLRLGVLNRLVVAIDRGNIRLGIAIPSLSRCSIGSLEGLDMTLARRARLLVLLVVNLARCLVTLANRSRIRN